ncbi:NADPH:quinone reductase-like Zn-dependent oxidoreductase [Catenuloplanes nepalensis]|uniref:NADPH:quinone reductase-like Zn-dependent oxidoreductase n=1 Tax=Catenuloplanes nepalensis TaxID=587533 RepID=A0ABT9MV55_9ACTN|nr:NAD(P)-dependent alcohol dehydrogenase [Catenuloplanes nepalensis]MDP9795324.1 NADPH:quinone reductase-like Zn-dependent oxidoreductase [Catenuloplanes nepalensis]
MKAIVQQRYGPAPAVLEVGEVATPVAGPGDVLVRVHAAAVNAADWHIMRGDPWIARIAAPAIFGRRGPRQPIRGRDIAGVVEAVGPGVERFTPGDEVYGDLGDAGGAFAEYAVAPSTSLAAKPGNLTFAEAASVPLAGSTALYGLRDLAGVRPGQSVLINGASGGVGTFAVQIAAALGAEVTGVCSTRNVDQVASLGAKDVIDYTRTDFAALGRRWDVLFDLTGRRTLADCRRALTPAGTLLLAGGGVFEGGSLFGPMAIQLRGRLLARAARPQRLLPLQITPRAEYLDALRDLIEAGTVRPVIEKTYPLEAAAAAVHHLEQEHSRAKLVLTVV